MAAESKGAFRTTKISHEYRENISGQVITVERVADNFTPPEPFYYVALLGQTKAPDSISANGVDVPVSIDVQALAASSTNSFCYDPTQQIIFVKIFDSEVTLTLLLAGLRPIAS
jgi:alpha-glucosidase